MLKLAPLVKAAGNEARGARLKVALCLSGQHGDVARTLCRELGLTPEVDLQAPAPSGDLNLTDSLASLMVGIGGALDRSQPKGVIVQGDTTTALAGALAAFHRELPLFHVEAGLRTSDPLRPFPEEMHRRLVSRLATLHLAPTEGARANLLAEGIPESSIRVTGNTIIDALHAFGLGGAPSAAPLMGLAPAAPARSTLLVTLHRRENEAAAQDIAAAVTELAARPDIEVVWVRHGNPTSRTALAFVGPDVRVVEPLPYAAFISLLSRARLVLTDSGGVQEEAPALGVPVVVLRTETDRPEAVTVGNAVVAGTRQADIVKACGTLLDSARPETRASSPFGDGRAAPRILDAITRHLLP